MRDGELCRNAAPHRTFAHKDTVYGPSMSEPTSVADLTGYFPPLSDDRAVIPQRRSGDLERRARPTTTMLGLSPTALEL
jgi:hypothetical protein